MADSKARNQHILLQRGCLQSNSFSFKAYDLTRTRRYLDAAKLAAGTFLKTMQDQQSTAASPGL